MVGLVSRIRIVSPNFKAGLGCTVVSATGQAMDSCVVDQTFPNLSKVKPANARCNVAPNAKVQISAQ